MMMAICRGNFAGSRPASASRFRVSGVRFILRQGSLPTTREDYWDPTRDFLQKRPHVFVRLGPAIFVNYSVDLPLVLTHLHAKNWRLLQNHARIYSCNIF